MNYMKTAILLAAMTALFMGVGFLVGGQGGMLIALAVACAMNFWSYWGSDKAVLNMYGAEEVDQHSAPDLYQMTWEMAQRAGMPMPRLFIIHEDQPNAFATGRNPENAAVAVNTGLLNALTREEVAGVVAHELAHIKNRDTLIMTITATLAGALSMLANFAAFSGGNSQNRNGFGVIGTIAMMILAPLAASIVQMAISRSREYEADKMGAEICGNPIWLAPMTARSTTPPSTIRRRRTCSSSTRCRASAWTTCSRPIPTPATASPPCSRSPRPGAWPVTSAMASRKRPPGAAMPAAAAPGADIRPLRVAAGAHGA